MGFSTDAIHAGQAPEPRTGAVITPLFQTSTYAQAGPGEHTGYEYGRTQNPTREALEQNIAALEKGKYGLAFASGLAAISTISQLFKSGDHFVATANVYGGTYRFFKQVMQEFGLSSTWTDTSNPENILRALTPQSKMVFLESPTNPMLALSDIAKIADMCKERGVILVVDNTFLSPYFQRPLELGADLVLHSTTKYLNGHSDVIGGMIITSDDALAERLRFLQNAVGAVPSPFDCWLTLRATKTLALRMEAHGRNALRIATALTETDGIERVIYPGLATHPQHDLACKQQLTPYGQPGFGGIISFVVRDFMSAQRILKRFKIFTLAESLGGVESLVCHPASMTHASVPKTMREEIGLSDGLIRLSVGVEDVEDLLKDVSDAIQGG
ncbi:PLP-dependent transferase [candidate division KSB1 bacterium]|nr:PLP-dependent transferase [candidate division KSB1 bacterium]